MTCELYQSPKSGGVLIQIPHEGIRLSPDDEAHVFATDRTFSEDQVIIILKRKQGILVPRTQRFDPSK